MELNPHLEIPLDEFVEKNMNLLHHLLNRKFKHLFTSGRFEYEDLLSVAAIGMVKAYRQFDPTKFERVTKFSTYGVPMILGEVQRFTRDDNPGPKFPRRAKEIGWRIRKNDWYDESKEFIRDEITAERLAANKDYPISVEDVALAFDYLTHVYSRSMDEQIGTHGSDSSPITLLDQHGAQADYSSIMVEDFLSHLPPRNRQIIELRMADVSQYDIGKVVGISQVEVSRIIKRLRPQLTQYLTSGVMAKPKPPKSNKVVPIKEEVIYMAKGDRTKAIHLLANTTLTYEDISRRTGVPKGTIGTLASKHRPQEVRDQLKAEAGKKRMQTMLEAKAAKKEVTAPIITPPPVDEALRQSIRDAELVSIKAMQELQKAIKESAKPEVKSLGDAINEFKEEVAKEALAEKAPLTEKEPKGKITRRVTFNYDADGQNITSQDFIEELEDLIEAVKSDTKRIVNFNISVSAS
jgi:RNA polymerase sigma factor (sigma-70 family)